ncbi:MAG: amidohydrolase family protein [Emcibacter sp.]|nr:amidohydrolase family protein [Emcibacter sp.]
MKKILIAAALITNLSIAHAADNITVIKAGHFIDVISGKVQTDQIIIIEGNRIKQVLKADQTMTLPEGATVIDLSDSTVMPGLLDSHVHLVGSSLYGYESLSMSTGRETIFGVVNAKKTLMAGFTAVRNVGAAAYADVALRDAINAGDVPGPRILVSGPALGITGGHCDENLLPPRYKDVTEGVADGPWAVRTKVRENIKYGADLIKFCGTGGVFSKGTRVGAQQYTLEEMKAIVDEAHMAGRKVTVHAHGTEGIKSAILAGADSIEHVSFLDDEGIKLAKKMGTTFSMDIYNDDYILEEGAKVGMLQESLDKEREVGLRQRQSFQAAVKAGVKMSYGTDAGVYPHGGNGKQMVKMVEWGMTPMQAVQTATLNTAVLFGMEKDIGAITEGRFADIIAIKGGDPLTDLSLFEKVSFVMKDGKIYKNE